MEKISLLKYVKEKNGIDDALYDNLRYTLDYHVYYFGEHFKYPHEKHGAEKKTQELKALLKKFFVYYNILTKKTDPGKKAVLSNAYFNFNEELIRAGYNVLQPCWSVRKGKGQILGDVKTYQRAERINQQLRNADLHYLTSSAFLEEFESFKKELASVFLKEDIKALFVPNDVSVFENTALSVFKEIGRPSFIFLHGLPARYNIIDENRSDYLIVWGPKIKEHYVNLGFSPDKILISGHPYYSSARSPQLRFGLDNILLLAKIGVGSHHSDGVKLYDRGHIIVYLLEMQRVLQKLGVKKVRLRFHPSANPEWHYKFIDRNFFELDTEPLSASLSKASLVLGPASTVMLEALYSGVNYLVFEPLEEGRTLLNEQPAPPFDGSDPRIPVARNEAELEQYLREKRMVNVDVLHEYIKTPFDIGFLKEMI